ncbi:hypothetical protein FRC12_012036 [Ceratobasidium sp. 428]|nr:hypothetical protein FRC12_012036 [Ceratobasidium sp. 428]
MSATIAYIYPQTQSELMLELGTTIQKLEAGLSGLSEDILRPKMEIIIDRLKRCLGVTHQLVGEVNIFSLICSNPVIAAWPDSKVRPGFEAYVDGVLATCTTPTSKYSETWGPMMGRLRGEFVKKIENRPKEGISLDPALRFTFALCKYERMVQKSRVAYMAGGRVNLLPDYTFNQLPRIMTVQLQVVCQKTTQTDQILWM